MANFRRRNNIIKPISLLLFFFVVVYINTLLVPLYVHTFSLWLSVSMCVCVYSHEIELAAFDNEHFDVNFCRLYKFNEINSLYNIYCILEAEIATLPTINQPWLFVWLVVFFSTTTSYYTCIHSTYIFIAWGSPNFDDIFVICIHV